MKQQPEFSVTGCLTLIAIVAIVFVFGGLARNITEDHVGTFAAIVVVGGGVGLVLFLVFKVLGVAGNWFAGGTSGGKRSRSRYSNDAEVRAANKRLQEEYREKEKRDRETAQWYRDEEQKKLNARPDHVKVADELRYQFHDYGEFWGNYHSHGDRFCQGLWVSRIHERVTAAAMSGRDLRAKKFAAEILSELNQECTEECQNHLTYELQHSPTWKGLWQALLSAHPDIKRHADTLSQEILLVEAVRWIGLHLDQFVDFKSSSRPYLRLDKSDPRSMFEHLQGLVRARLQDLKAREFAAAEDARQKAAVISPAPARPSNMNRAERARRDAAHHQVELTFVDHAADVKGIFGLREFEAWRNEQLGDHRDLAEIEQMAADFPTLMKKHAVHRRLRTLYDDFASEVEDSYSRAMLDNFIRTRLSVENDLEDVVAAAMELESRLVTLSERVKRDRAIEKLKATKREMQKRSEGVDALASAVGDIEFFDEKERQELQQMALDAADRAKTSVFSDLLKKETGDVVRQLSHKS